MDHSPQETMSRGPVDALRTSLRNGINRYRAMKHAPESRRMLAGTAVSYVGRRFNTVALVVLSYKLGDGALGVGGMLAIQLFPGVVFQPWAGTIVDKFPGKRLAIICQMLMVLISLSYILLMSYPSIWLLYAITFIFGTIQTVDMPALEVRIMSLTPNEKRGTANALQSLSITAGEVIGPLLGSLVLALAGSTVLFILSASTYAFLGLTIARLPERVGGARRVEDAEDEKLAEAQAVSQQGYRGLLRRTDVLLYTGMVTGSYFLFYGLIPLFIVRATEIGMSAESVGVFYAVMGVGGLLGGIFSGMGTYLTRSALAVSGICAVFSALAVMMFGMAGTVFLVFPLLILIGIIGEIEEIPALTYFQNHLPESIYGRFFSIFMMVGAIGGLGGSLLGPILAHQFSTSIALTALALPVIVLGFLFAVREGGLRLSIPWLTASPVSAIVFDALASPTRTEIVPSEMSPSINEHANELLAAGDAD